MQVQILSGGLRPTERPISHHVVVQRVLPPAAAVPTENNVKYSKHQEKLLRRQAAWDSIKESRMITPNIKVANRSQGTNIYRKPGSQKK